MGAAVMPENTPQLSPEWIEFMGPLLTESARALARSRLTTSDNFFRGEKLAVDAPRATVKVALLLVRALNPTEELSAEEEALLRGRCAKTIRTRKSVTGKIR